MNIRPFVAEDADAVASLWQYWFKDKTRNPDPALAALVRRVYVEDPNVDEEIPSLVAEGDDGKMLGFLGANIMPVEVDGRMAKMAGIFPSVVDPDASTTVASFLLRRFLGGSQAFTFSDGGHAKFERIWEALGGQIAHLPSLRWVKLLRPLELVVSSGRGRKRLGPLAPVARPFAKGGDALLRRLEGQRFKAPPSVDGLKPRQDEAEPYTLENLTPSDIAQVTPAMHAGARLRPLYDRVHMEWQFAAMAKITEQGEFTARLVRLHNGQVAGWFVYYMKPGGVSRVFAIEGHKRYLATVMSALIIDADSRGAGALIGRLEPRLRRIAAQHTEIVYSKGSLQMVHSKDPTLMTEAQLGRLAYSRLQGENWYWWALDSKVIE